MGSALRRPGGPGRSRSAFLRVEAAGGHGEDAARYGVEYFVGVVGGANADVLEGGLLHGWSCACEGAGAGAGRCVGGEDGGKEKEAEADRYMREAEEALIWCRGAGVPWALGAK